MRRRRSLAVLVSFACAGLPWLLGCAALNRPEPKGAGPTFANPATASAIAPERVRVATYNVRGEPAAAIARAVREDPNLAGVDVLFLQEIEVRSEHTPRELAARLGWSYLYAPGYGIGARGSHGVAIVSRLAISEPEVIELPRHHVVFNSARRVAVAVTVRVGDRPVRLYSVHLDNRINPADRVAQLAPVLAAARRAPHMPAVIAGDMNTSPFCWVGHVVPVPCGLQDNRLEALVRASGFDTPVRSSGATSEWLGMRLDAIYTRHLAVGDFGVSGGARMSDHFPLWAELAVADQASTR